MRPRTNKNSLLLVKGIWAACAILSNLFLLVGSWCIWLRAQTVHPTLTAAVALGRSWCWWPFGAGVGGWLTYRGPKARLAGWRLLWPFLIASIQKYRWVPSTPYHGIRGDDAAESGIPPSWERHGEGQSAAHSQCHSSDCTVCKITVLPEADKTWAFYVIILITK